MSEYKPFKLRTWDEIEADKQRELDEYIYRTQKMPYTYPTQYQDPTILEQAANVGLGLIQGSARAVQQFPELGLIVGNALSDGRFENTEDGKFLRFLSNRSSEAIRGLEKMKPRSIQHANQQQIVDPLTGNVNITPSVVLNTISQALPMIPGIIVGGGAASGKIAGKLAEKGFKKADRTGNYLGYGGVGGVVGGIENNPEIAERIQHHLEKQVDTDTGEKLYSQEEINRRIGQATVESTKNQLPISMLTSGYGLGKTASAITSAMSREGAKDVAKAIGSGVLRESPSEAIEEYFQAGNANKAVRDYADPTVDEWDGRLDATILGGIAGAATAGTFSGGIAYNQVLNNQFLKNFGVDPVEFRQQQEGQKNQPSPPEIISSVEDGGGIIRDIELTPEELAEYDNPIDLENIRIAKQKAAAEKAQAEMKQHAIQRNSVDSNVYARKDTITDDLLAQLAQQQNQSVNAVQPTIDQTNTTNLGKNLDESTIEGQLLDPQQAINQDKLQLEKGAIEGELAKDELYLSKTKKLTGPQAKNIFGDQEVTQEQINLLPNLSQHPALSDYSGVSNEQAQPVVDKLLSGKPLNKEEKFIARKLADLSSQLIATNQPTEAAPEVAPDVQTQTDVQPELEPQVEPETKAQSGVQANPSCNITASAVSTVKLSATK